jgi:hypothetical protein
MMNVLDALRYRLGDPDVQGLDPVELEMIGRRPLPPGLPLGVQNQIQTQPSYGEGDVMAPQQWWNEAMGEPLMQSGPQREETLSFDRRQALGIPDPYIDPWQDPAAMAMPEGGMWSSRPPEISPFSSPLNQMLQRPPFGQY